MIRYRNHIHLCTELFSKGIEYRGIQKRGKTLQYTKQSLLYIDGRGFAVTASSTVPMAGLRTLVAVISGISKYCAIADC